MTEKAESPGATGSIEEDGQGARRLGEHLVLAAAVLGLLGGLLAAGLGERAAAGWIWGAGTLFCLAWLSVGVLRDLLRGRAGVDLIALLAMGGALWVGEQLAGAVVALMLAGGQELERFAGGRARRELAALVSRAPRIAHRIGPAGVSDLPLAEVRPGDRLLVRSGEVLPVDGRVAAGAAALLDESALTGEPLPVERPAGDAARSGTLNAGTPFEMMATATAEASTYAGILRLVAGAERDKAPMVRLADRYAVFFLPFTLLVAAVAWIAAGDPLRALAVLVVATPCPLILAAPVAIVAGLSRAARTGVIIKGGGALEVLARSTIVLLDKTGTLTRGEPRLSRVDAEPGFEGDELLRLAASLETASAHVLAPAVVAGARARGLALSLPERVREQAGDGIEGQVEGRAVRVGQRGWVAPEAGETGAGGGASSSPWVAIDGRLAGMLLLEDEIRPEAAATLAALRRGGIREILLVTGDRRAAGEAVGAAAGVDRVIAEASPADKVEAIAAARSRGVAVMVGDGINDAPALAAADVGVAMGARGASAASETADVVIVADRLDLLAEAIVIARRSRDIARQSIVAGMALSGIGMLLAACGLLPPLAGAIAQEAIDLAVILNALRALGSGRGAGPGRLAADDGKAAA